MSRASASFEIEGSTDGDATHLVVTDGEGRRRDYRIAGRTQADYARFFAEVAADSAIRGPHRAAAAVEVAPATAWRPLITRNLSPRILSGYGDPAV